LKEKASRERRRSHFPFAFFPFIPSPLHFSRSTSIANLNCGIREYYCVMNTDSTTTFNVVNLDTGKQVRVITAWQYEPVDITYVQWSS